MININEIKENLQSALIAKRIFFYENLDSTNLEAQRLINSSQAKFGDLIIAKTQSSGKGQQNNEWASPEGGLYISIITASKSNEFSNLITFAAGIACIEAIYSTFGVLANLKWVNDIIFEGNKLGGILTQSVTRGEVSTNVSGIGINVNSVLPCVNSKYKAVSLTELTETNVNINVLTANICNYFEKYFDLYQNDTGLIVEKWLKYANITNKTVIFEVEGKKLTGVTRTVNKYGHLLVLSDSKLYTLSSTKNVEFC